MKKILSTVLLFCLSIFTLSTYLKVNAATSTQPVRDGDTYLGREFNDAFDRMFDNFERATMEAASEAGLWWASSESEVKATFTDRDGVLHVAYGPAATTTDAAIYKAASEANSAGSYPYLVFVMKGTGKIADLELQFRYDDNHDLITVPFNALLDPDGETFPELTNEYHRYIINLADTLDGMEYTREGETTIPAGTSMAGFHLISKAETTGTVDITEVYYTSNENSLGYTEGSDFLFDNFKDKTDPNKNIPGVWWCGSVGEIIGKHLEMPATSTYKAGGYDPSNATDTYKYMVVRVKGATGGETFSIKPFWVTDNGDVWGDVIAYTSFVGPDEMALPAITKTFTGLVIDLEQSGITPKNINGLEITSDNGLIYVDQIFFTNMEYDASEVCTDFPVLDSSDIVLWDDFNRETLGANDTFVANDPIAVENDLDYIISYAGLNQLSIVDGAVVFDSTTSTSDKDYIQLCEASTRYQNDGTYPYLVMKVKVTDGGTLANFRIKTSVSGVRSNDVWANGGLKSGNKFPVATELTENYRYTTADGYIYMIVDLASSGLNTAFDGIDFYYSGKGKLLIDSVFFAKASKDTPDQTKTITFDDFERAEANHADWWADTDAAIEEGALKLDGTNDTYHHYRTARPINNFDYGYPYLSLKMKGSEGATLESFRFGVTDSNEAALYFVNQGTIVLADGRTLTADMLTTEYQEFIIDMAASGMQEYKALGLGIHYGGWGPAGILYIDEIKYIGTADVVTAIETKLTELAAEKESRPLDTPVVSIEGSIVTITAVSKAEKYEIYVDGTLVTTITELTVDLSAHNIAAGNHKVTVKAIAEGHTSSEVSEELAYTVETTTPDPDPDPDPDPTPDPEPTNDKGCNCNKSAVISVVASVMAISVAVIVLRKRH